MTGTPRRGGGPARRRPRADGLRNRARVAEAAYVVFVERGLDATVAQVAERAGVGSATVFRHFPTKADLLPALVERLRRDRFTRDVLRAATLHPEVERARQQTERLFTTALERAIEDGQVRADVTYADLTILVLGTAGQLADFKDFDPERWRRHALFVWAAIRAR